MNNLRCVPANSGESIEVDRFEFMTRKERDRL